VLGRIGSSDVNGSFIIEGMIDYLMDNVEFESMKRVFDFYFVPLANIDGIKYGNSLTNLTGSVLNNNWRTPHRFYQAEVFSLKEFLQ
jgi:murein tripeptide amidase MpaA